MASLYESLAPKSEYWERKKQQPEEIAKLENSTTVYVGNLSIYTREECIYALFAKCGEVKKLIIGLNRQNKTPCGFCFVEFYSHQEAGYAVDCLNQAKLDGRTIRVDWDTGFVEGRQFGRGKSGGQIRDEVRGYDDPERAQPGQQFQKKGGDYDRDRRGDHDRDRRGDYDRDRRGDYGGRRRGGGGSRERSHV
jgi:nuclear cap-binding protein subunit 2